MPVHPPVPHASQQLQDIASGKPAHLSNRCFGGAARTAQPDVRQMQFLVDLAKQCWLVASFRVWGGLAPVVGWVVPPASLPMGRGRIPRCQQT